MEASALRHAPRVPVLTGLSPHLRLQSDERLIALIRRGHQGAFEALLRRYQPRLLAFCRHMLGSNEDAEDVLQEVFASAYTAICADERPINARPWLYRIARNRCLNHLRRPHDAGQESMDVFERESGATAADTVHTREEFRQVIADVHGLPESQRTALLLREIDTLSYDQIADAMDTTIPSVKSLLVRARMSLAEAAEARQLTCSEVRLQLTQAAEGIGKPPAATRRHVRSCARCRSFRRELRRTSQALAAVAPLGPIAALKALAGGGTAGAGNGAGAAGGSTVAGGIAAGGGGTTGLISAVGGSLVAKTAAGLVTAALVTTGAAKVASSGDDDRDPATASSAAAASTNEAFRPPPLSSFYRAATDRPTGPAHSAGPATPGAGEAASPGSPELAATAAKPPPAIAQPQTEVPVEEIPVAPVAEPAPPVTGEGGATLGSEGVTTTEPSSGSGEGGGFPPVTSSPEEPPADGGGSPAEPAPGGREGDGARSSSSSGSG